MPSDSSPSHKMKPSEDRRGQQQPSNAQQVFPSHYENFDENCQSLVTGLRPPEEEVRSSDAELETQRGEKLHRPQQLLLNPMPALEQGSLPTKLTQTFSHKVDGEKRREPNCPQESSVQISSLQEKKAKRRKPLRGDMDICPSQQKNVIEVNQMQEKMSPSQELYPASQSNFKSESGDHQMSSDPSEETSWVPTVSLQSSIVCEQQPNITKSPEEHSHGISCGLGTKQSKNHSITKKNKHAFVSVDQMDKYMLHQRKPDSLVCHEASTERTKSHHGQLVTLIPDALEGCKNECQSSAEKPTDTGDDRQANEKAAEAIVTGQEERERERLPRAVFTKRKPLPSIKRGPRKNSQKARVVMEGTRRVRPSTLDFFTKYCIINPERLSFYERIFLKYCNHEDSVARTVARWGRAGEEEDSDIPGDQESTDTSNIHFNDIPDGFDHIEEILIQKKAKENIDVGRKIQMILGSGSVSDQLGKIQFKIRTLMERKKYIVSTVQELQDQRTALQATTATQPSHTAEEKRNKKKRKGKKNTKLLPNMDELEDKLYEMTSSAPINQVKETKNTIFY
ncbi:uncharacterized protein LOC128341223 isoform X2 [Hemicordylus capensis]|uniref:uncharacterized protein LOC128341223 isoform X2 n=1 Tax=Hemicordylus capensis TaxID=884348 RepID=UPI002304030E|nr:uncharacterized protein LOC128341223 isoform X2 [Hemicordylus capensis]